MNHEETAKLLGLIASRFPAANLGQNQRATVAMWQRTLAEIPAAAMGPVLDRWCERNRFAPDASELRAAVLTDVERERFGPGPFGAWQYVRNELDFMRRHEGKRPVLGPLHPLIERAVSAIGGWGEVTGDRWERKEFLAAYGEFQAEARRGHERPVGQGSGEDMPPMIETGSPAMETGAS